MSNFVYPFDINSKSIKIYLQIIKNCFRLIEKNGIHIKIDGLIVYLRFNNNLDCYYIIINNKEYYLQNEIIENLSENYKKTIFLFKKLLEQENFLKILETLKINKFSNRNISFIFKDNILYPTCLFTTTLGINKNLLVFNDLFFYFKDIKLIKSTSLNLDIKESYSNLYNKFLSQLKTLSINTNNKKVKIESLYDLTLNKKCNKISFKQFQITKDFAGEVLNKDMFYYLIYLITIEFNLFLNKNFNLGNVDLMFFDKESNRIIKIPFKMSNHIELKEIKKDLLPPLLPVRL